MLKSHRAFLGLALLLATVGDSAAKSHWPPPRNRESIEPPQTQSTQTKEPTPQYPSGTEQSPVIVKILPSPDAEKKAADEAKHEQQKATNDDRLARFTERLFWATVALSVIAALQLFIFGWQGIQLKRTVCATEKSANAATRSADAVVSQLRAYVVVSSARIHDFGITLPPKILIVTKNTGQTPAIDMLSWAGLVISKFPLDIALRPPGPELKISRSILGPGIESAHWIQAERSLTQIEIDLINTGKWAIYVFGEITYKDVFKDERVTHYCMMYGGGGGASPDGALIVCEDGNEAD